jgi:uncharacterized protein (TIGR04141 family)
MANKLQTLNIFLLKENVTEDAALRVANDARRYAVRFADGTTGSLYVPPSYSKVPFWHTFLSPAVVDLPEVWTSSASALMIVPRGDTLFAISFGYGKSLLESGSWEEDFGLKVTLNSVDASKLRSVDRMSFDAIGQHSTIQASREADISEFGLDLEQDMLRAVSGKPRDPSLGARLAGKDSLQVSIKINLDNIPQILERYHTQWRSDEYRARFPWVDQIATIKTPILIATLNELMLNRISERELDNIWLSIPELIDWAAIDGFAYRDTRHAAIHPDVHLREYLEEVRPRRLDVAFLKRRQVRAVNADGQEVKSWPLFRCVYAEIEHDESTYVLTNGKWYGIGERFLQRVNAEYNAILEPIALVLPDYEDDCEETYNARVCNERPAEFALMDGKTIVCDGPRDKVEFCDLYGHNKRLVHVKRYAGSSAPLSHLFAQAFVSATTFRRDGDFRTMANDLLPDAFRPVLNRPERDEYEVVLGIVSKSRRPLKLPFFSRVNLNSTKERIEDQGFRVAVLKVQAV